MNIKVRLFATLREGRGREVILELAEGSAVQEAIDTLRISKEDVSILLVNGRDTTPEQVLSDGDIISIFPPVGGG